MSSVLCIAPTLVTAAAASDSQATASCACRQAKDATNVSPEHEKERQLAQRNDTATRSAGRCNSGAHACNHPAHSGHALGRSLCDLVDAELLRLVEEQQDGGLDARHHQVHAPLGEVGCGTKSRQ